MIIKWILIVITVYFICVAIVRANDVGGISFAANQAMTTGKAHHLIPVFSSFNHALKWAITVKGNTYFIEAMEKNIIWLKNQIKTNGQTRNFALHQQIAYCQFSLSNQKKFYDEGDEGNREYTIVEFQSAQDAAERANRWKWIEPLRIKLIDYINDMHRQSENSNKQEDIEYYQNQWQWGRLALTIMESYKRRGIHGDMAQLGSLVHSYSIPWSIPQ